MNKTDRNWDITMDDDQCTSDAIDNDNDVHHLHKDDDMTSTGIVITYVGIIPGSLFTLKEQPTSSTT